MTAKGDADLSALLRVGGLAGQAGVGQSLLSGKAILALRIQLLILLLLQVLLLLLLVLAELAGVGLRASETRIAALLSIRIRRGSWQVNLP